MIKIMKEGREGKNMEGKGYERRLMGEKMKGKKGEGKTTVKGWRRGEQRAKE